MISRSFYFVRHGETDWNARGLMQGHTDIPLNDRGRAQAQAAVATFKTLPIGRIICSPLSRAHETAQIINGHLQKPLDLDHGLRERHFGDFEGKNTGDMEALKAQLREAHPDLPPEENGYHCPPQAEPYAAFKTRTLETLNRHLAAFPDQNILFVCHGGLYRVLSRALIGATDSSPNVQPYHFEKAGENWGITALTAV